MIQNFIKNINPSFNNWDQLYWLMDQFKHWEIDKNEPPSSGAFLCASKSNDLAAGCVAFFSCAGDKHLPFEKCINQFRRKDFNMVAQEKFKYGFGHPVFDQDPRVNAFFEKFDSHEFMMETARKYATKNRTPCLNFAGLFGVWCVDNGLDERAAILPLFSRLLGLTEDYSYNKKLPSSYDCVKTQIVS